MTIDDFNILNVYDGAPGNRHERSEREKQDHELPFVVLVSVEHRTLVDELKGSEEAAQRGTTSILKPLSHVWFIKNAKSLNQDGDLVLLGKVYTKYTASCGKLTQRIMCFLLELFKIDKARPDMVKARADVAMRRPVDSALREEAAEAVPSGSW